MRTNHPLSRIISTALCVVVFSTNTLLAYTPEANFWKDRQKTIRPAPKPIQLASLPKISPSNFQSQISNPLPSFIENQKLKLDGPNRTVIYIQDIHMNAEAERGISDGLRSLISNKSVDMVALEGAFGSMDLSPFKNFERPELVGQAAEFLLKQKQISGPIHAALVVAENTPFVGVDDKKEYDANVQAYRLSQVNIAETKQALKKERAELDARKKEVFNSDLSAYDRRVEDYRRGESRLSDHVAFLMDAHSDVEYPNAALLIEASKMERALDFKQVESQRAVVIDALARRMGREEMQELTGVAAAFRMGEVDAVSFYQRLESACSHVNFDLGVTPAFKTYLRYVRTAYAVDSDALFAEISRLEETGYDAHVKNAQERELVNAAKRASLTEKLINFSLTRAEWEEYESSSWHVVSQDPSLDPGLRRSRVTNFEGFYHAALERDQLMAQNLVKEMDRRGAKVAVFVGGGFHTQGIKKYLSARGIAQVTFTPKISAVEKDGEISYLNEFTRAKTPLERLFEGDQLFLARERLTPVITGTLAVLICAGAARLGIEAISMQNMCSLLGVAVPVGFHVANKWVDLDFHVNTVRVMFDGMQFSEMPQVLASNAALALVTWTEALSAVPPIALGLMLVVAICVVSPMGRGVRSALRQKVFKIFDAKELPKAGRTMARMASELLFEVAPVLVLDALFFITTGQKYDLGTAHAIILVALLTGRVLINANFASTVPVIRAQARCGLVNVGLQMFGLAAFSAAQTAGFLFPGEAPLGGAIFFVLLALVLPPVAVVLSERFIGSYQRLNARFIRSRNLFEALRAILLPQWFIIPFFSNIDPTKPFDAAIVSDVDGVVREKHDADRVDPHVAKLNERLIGTERVGITYVSGSPVLRSDPFSKEDRKKPENAWRIDNAPIGPLFQNSLAFAPTQISLYGANGGQKLIWNASDKPNQALDWKTSIDHQAYKSYDRIEAFEGQVCLLEAYLNVAEKYAGKKHRPWSFDRHKMLEAIDRARIVLAEIESDPPPLSPRHDGHPPITHPVFYQVMKIIISDINPDNNLRLIWRGSEVELITDKTEPEIKLEQLEGELARAMMKRKGTSLMKRPASERTIFFGPRFIKISLVSKGPIAAEVFNQAKEAAKKSQQTIVISIGDQGVDLAMHKQVDFGFNVGIAKVFGLYERGNTTLVRSAGGRVKTLVEGTEQVLFNLEEAVRRQLPFMQYRFFQMPDENGRWVWRSLHEVELFSGGRRSVQQLRFQQAMLCWAGASTLAFVVFGLAIFLVYFACRSQWNTIIATVAAGVLLMGILLSAVYIALNVQLSYEQDLHDNSFSQKIRETLERSYNARLIFNEAKMWTDYAGEFYSESDSAADRQTQIDFLATAIDAATEKAAERWRIAKNDRTKVENLNYFHEAYRKLCVLEMARENLFKTLTQKDLTLPSSISFERAPIDAKTFYRYVKDRVPPEPKQVVMINTDPLRRPLRSYSAESREVFMDEASLNSVPEKSCDVVIIEGLEQVPQSQELLARAYAMLAPGGQLVMTASRYMNADAPYSPRQVLQYNRTLLQGRLEKVGFELNENSWHARVTSGNDVSYETQDRHLYRDLYDNYTYVVFARRVMIPTTRMIDNSELSISLRKYLLNAVNNGDGENARRIIMKLDKLGWVCSVLDENNIDVVWAQLQTALGRTIDEPALKRQTQGFRTVFSKLAHEKGSRVVLFAPKNHPGMESGITRLQVLIVPAPTNGVNKNWEADFRERALLTMPQLLYYAMDPDALDQNPVDVVLKDSKASQYSFPWRAVNELEIDIDHVQMERIGRRQKDMKGGSGAGIVIVPLKNRRYAVLKSVTNAMDLTANQTLERGVRFVRVHLVQTPALQRAFPKDFDAGYRDGRYFLLMEEIPRRDVIRDLQMGGITPHAAVTAWWMAFELFMSAIPEAGRAKPKIHSALVPVERVLERLGALRQEFREEFGSIAESNKVEIGGASYHNLNEASNLIIELSKLDKNGILSAEFNDLMHLDLFPSNIIAIYDSTKRVIDHVRLLDPRGDKLGDGPYDIAKGLHAAEFHMTGTNFFFADWNLDGQAPAANFGFSDPPKTPAGERERNFIRGLHEYTGYFDKLSTVKAQEYEKKFGPNWKLRFFYYHAVLWASMPIFFARMRTDAAMRTAKTRYAIGTVYLNKFAVMYADSLRKSGVTIPNEIQTQLNGVQGFDLEKPLGEQTMLEEHLKTKPEIVNVAYETREKKEAKSFVPYALVLAVSIMVFRITPIQFQGMPAILIAISGALVIHEVSVLMWYHIVYAYNRQRGTGHSTHDAQRMIEKQFENLRKNWPELDEACKQRGVPEIRSVFTSQMGMFGFMMSGMRQGNVILIPHALAGRETVLVHELAHWLTDTGRAPPRSFIWKFLAFIPTYFYREFSAIAAEWRYSLSKTGQLDQLNLKNHHKKASFEAAPSTPQPLTEVDKLISLSNKKLNDMHGQGLLDHAKLAYAEDYAAKIAETAPTGIAHPMFLKDTNDKEEIRAEDFGVDGVVVFIPERYVRKGSGVSLQLESGNAGMRSDDREAHEALFILQNETRDRHYLSIYNRILYSEEFQRRFYRDHWGKVLMTLPFWLSVKLVFNWVDGEGHPSRYVPVAMQTWFNMSHGYGRYKSMDLMARHRAGEHLKKAVAYMTVIPDVMDPKRKDVPEESRPKALRVPHVDDLLGKKSFKYGPKHESPYAPNSEPYEAFPVDNQGRDLPRGEVRRAVAAGMAQVDRALYSGHIPYRVLTDGLTRRLMRGGMAAALITLRYVYSQIAQIPEKDVKLPFSDIPILFRFFLQRLALVQEIAEKRGWDTEVGFLNQRFIIPVNAKHADQIINALIRVNFLGLPPHHFYFVVQSHGPGYGMKNGRIVNLEFDREDTAFGTRGNGDMMARQNLPHAVFTIDRDGHRFYRRTSLHQLFRSQGAVIDHHQISFNHGIDPEYARNPAHLGIGLAAKSLGLLAASQMRIDRTGIAGAGAARLDWVPGQVKDFYQTDRNRMAVMLETVQLGSSVGYRPSVNLKNAFSGFTFAAALAYNTACLPVLTWFAPSLVARGYDMVVGEKEIQLNVNIDAETWGYGDLNVKEVLHYDPGYERNETKDKKGYPQLFALMQKQDDKDLNPHFVRVASPVQALISQTGGVIPQITATLLPKVIRFLARFNVSETNAWRTYRWFVAPIREESLWPMIFAVVAQLASSSPEIGTLVFAIAQIAVKLRFIFLHPNGMRGSPMLIAVLSLLIQIPLQYVFSATPALGFISVYCTNVLIHIGINFTVDVRTSNTRRLAQVVVTAILFASSRSVYADPNHTAHILKGILHGSPMMLDVNSLGGQFAQALGEIQIGQIDRNLFVREFEMEMARRTMRPVSIERSAEILREFAGENGESLAQLVRHAQAFENIKARQWQGILTDIDYCITDRDRNVPKSVIRVIAEKLRQGVRVGLVTARSYKVPENDDKARGAEKVVEQIRAELADVPEAMRLLDIFAENASYGFNAAEPDKVYYRFTAPVDGSSMEDFQKQIQPVVNQIYQQRIGIPYTEKIAFKGGSVTVRFNELKDRIPALEEIKLVRGAIEGFFAERGIAVDINWTGNSYDIMRKGVNKTLAREKFSEFLGSDDFLSIDDKGRKSENGHPLVDRFGGISVDSVDWDGAGVSVPLLTGKVGYRAWLDAVNQCEFAVASPREENAGKDMQLAPMPPAQVTLSKGMYLTFHPAAYADLERAFSSENVDVFMQAAIPDSDGWPNLPLTDNIRNQKRFRQFHNDVLANLDYAAKRAPDVMSTGNTLFNQLEALVVAFCSIKGIDTLSQAAAREKMNTLMERWEQLRDKSDQAACRAFFVEMLQLWEEGDKHDIENVRTVNQLVNVIHSIFSRNLFNQEGVKRDMEVHLPAYWQQYFPEDIRAGKVKDEMIWVDRTSLWMEKLLGTDHKAQFYFNLVPPSFGGEIDFIYRDWLDLGNHHTIYTRNGKQLRSEVLMEAFRMMGFTVQPLTSSPGFTTEVDFRAHYGRAEGAQNIHDLTLRMRAGLMALSQTFNMDHRLRDVQNLLKEPHRFVHQKYAYAALDAVGYPRDVTKPGRWEEIRQTEKLIVDGWARKILMSSGQVDLREMVNAELRDASYNRTDDTDSDEGIAMPIEDLRIGDAFPSANLAAQGENVVTVNSMGDESERYSTRIWNFRAPYTDTQTRAFAYHAPMIYHTLNFCLRKWGLPVMPPYSDDTFNQFFIHTHFSRPVGRAFEEGRLIWSQGRAIMNPMFEDIDAPTAFIGQWLKRGMKMPMLEAGALIQPVPLKYFYVGRIGGAVLMRAELSLVSGRHYVYALYNDEKLIAGLVTRIDGTVLKVSDVERIFSASDIPIADDPKISTSIDDVESVMKKTVASSVYPKRYVRGVPFIPGTATGLMTFDQNQQSYDGQILFADTLTDTNVGLIASANGIINRVGNSLDHLSLRASKLAIDEDGGTHPRITVSSLRLQRDEQGLYLPVEEFFVDEHESYQGYSLAVARKSQNNGEVQKIRAGDLVTIDGESGAMYWAGKQENTKTIYEAYRLLRNLNAQSGQSSKHDLAELIRFVDSELQSGQIRATSFIMRALLLNERIGKSLRLNEIEQDKKNEELSAFVRHIIRQAMQRKASGEHDLAEFLAHVYHFSKEEFLKVFNSTISGLDEVTHMPQLEYACSRLQSRFEAFNHLQSLLEEMVERNDLLNMSRMKHTINAAVTHQVQRLWQLDQSLSVSEKLLQTRYVPLLEKILAKKEFLGGKGRPLSSRDQGLSHKVEALKVNRATWIKSQVGAYKTDLRHLQSDDHNRVGNKAANLGWMIQFLSWMREMGGTSADLARHFRVPNGFSFTTKAYNDFVDQKSPRNPALSVRHEIENILAASASNADKSRHIEEIILHTPLPEVIRAIIGEVSTGEQHSVRSSTLIEDRADQSAAGLFESTLHLKTHVEIEAALKVTWVSLFSERALDFCEDTDELTAQSTQGAIVQEMVRADAAGVLTSADPNRQDLNTFVINAKRGTAENLVRGDEMGDVFHISRKIGPIRRGEDVDKCLTYEDQVLLWKFAKEAERWFGYVVDIEFAKKDGFIYLLQIRPIPGFQLNSAEVKKTAKWLNLPMIAASSGVNPVEAVVDQLMMLSEGHFIERMKAIQEQLGDYARVATFILEKLEHLREPGVRNQLVQMLTPIFAASDQVASVLLKSVVLTPASLEQYLPVEASLRKALACFNSELLKREDFDAQLWMDNQHILNVMPEAQTRATIDGQTSFLRNTVAFIVSRIVPDEQMKRHVVRVINKNLGKSARHASAEKSVPIAEAREWVLNAAMLHEIAHLIVPEEHHDVLERQLTEIGLGPVLLPGALPTFEQLYARLFNLIATKYPDQVKFLSATPETIVPYETVQVRPVDDDGTMIEEPLPALPQAPIAPARPLPFANGVAGFAQLVAINSDGRRMVKAVSYPQDVTNLSVFDIETGSTWRKDLELHSDAIKSAGFGPNGESLVIGTESGLILHVDRQDVTAVRRQKRRTLPEIVWGLEYLPDGKHVVAILGKRGRPGAIEIWNTDGNTLVKRIKLDGQPTAFAYQLDENSNLKTVLVAMKNDRWKTSQIHQIDAEHGLKLHECVSAMENVAVLRWLSNGSRFVAGGELGMEIWRNGDSLQLVSSQTEIGSVNAIVIHPSGDSFAAAGGRGMVVLWDSQTLEPLRGLGPQAESFVSVDAMSFSADGRMLFTMSRHGGRADAFDSENRTKDDDYRIPPKRDGSFFSATGNGHRLPTEEVERRMRSLKKTAPQA